MKTLRGNQVQVSDISQNLQSFKKCTSAVMFSTPEPSDDEIDEPPTVHKININDWVSINYDFNVYLCILGVCY